MAATVPRHNEHRKSEAQIERAALAPMPHRPTTDFTETTVVVTRNAKITVKKVTESIPSQLIGHRPRVHLYDDRLEAWLGDTHVPKTTCVHAVGKRGFRNLACCEAVFPRPAYRCLAGSG